MPHHKKKRTYKNKKKTKKIKLKNRTKVRQSKVKHKKINRTRVKKKEKRTKKIIQKGGISTTWDEFIQKRAYAALDCKNEKDKSIEKCSQNLIKKIFAGEEGKKNNKLMEAFVDDRPNTITIHKYIQDLIRQILAGEKEKENKEAGKNNKLMEAFLDNRPNTITIHEYIVDLVKNILWSLFSSMLTGKDAIDLPESWDKHLTHQSDKKILDKLEEITGQKEKDPNICLRHLLSSVVYKSIPGTSTIDSMSNALSNLVSAPPKKDND